MSKCETIIFSDKAYNAIIRESFSKHPVETGGILLGYILDSMWIVMEVVPPGINGIFEPAYFEPDQDFVNYLSLSIANQYKAPLELLGLWHRHPGSMDYFSSTDDRTNAAYASKNPNGAISGLVNVDPAFRLTMYHLEHSHGNRPQNVAYSAVEIVVGDNYIDEELFALRYVDNQRSELHPTPTHTNIQISQIRNVPKSPRNGSGDEMVEDTPAEADDQPAAKPAISVKDKPKQKRKWLLPTAAAIIFLLGVFIGVKAVPLFDKWESTKTEKVKTDKDKSDKSKNDKDKNDGKH